MRIDTETREKIFQKIRASIRFYKTTSFVAFWFWRACQIMIVLGSAGGAVAAALISEVHDDNKKIWAVALSGSATLAATLLTTMKFGEHHRIREIALAGMRKIETDLEIHFALTDAGSEDPAGLAQIIDRIATIEFDQVKLMKALESTSIHQPS